MDPLSPADLQHLTRLARLKVPDELLPQYAAQLGQILALFETMRTVDTSGVGTVLATFGDLTLDPRPDVPVPSLPRDRALAPSSRREGDFIAVPQVMGGAAVEGD